MNDHNYFFVVKESKKNYIEKIKNTPFTIGRSIRDNITLTSKGVSRCHATVYFSDGYLWIIDGDLEGRTSTNGLLVNGQRVLVHKLNQLDIVTFQKGVHAIFFDQKLILEQNQLFENFVSNLVSFVSGASIHNLKSENVNLKEPIETTSTHTQKNPFIDELTGLASRESFLNRVKRTLEFRKNIEENHNFAVLFIDVDRFKMINDSLGHLIGDKFLIQIAQALGKFVRNADMVARLGGDEFAILLDKLETLDQAITIVERLQDYLTRPLKIDSHELYCSISIGLAMSSLNYQSVEELMRDADIAMYRAKTTGRSKFVVFDQEMHQQAIKSLQLDNDLRKAAKNQDLQLYYQPIVSLYDYKIVGFEALIRWNHPELGFISPEVFIPIAEETNLICDIGGWVLNQACKQLNYWQQNLNVSTACSIHVNVSTKQLVGAELVEQVKEVIQKYDINPYKLKLEITESTIMESVSNSIKIFHQLKDLGIQLAIDDFGTGYSSLTYLNKLPIDTLKIDKSFISEIDDNNPNTSFNVTQSIIGLAHSLKVKVVAEGIEKIRHLTWLKERKCDYGQGFLFSKPVNSCEAGRLLEKGLEQTKFENC
ncbi:MAG: EAL domain-containing protein [Thainema sp.]